MYHPDMGSYAQYVGDVAYPEPATVVAELDGPVADVFGEDFGDDGRMIDWADHLQD